MSTVCPMSQSSVLRSQKAIGIPIKIDESNFSASHASDDEQSLRLTIDILVVLSL